jgi:hypothetical protein
MTRGEGLRHSRWRRSSSEQTKEERGGINKAEGPGGALDGGPTGGDTCCHLIGLV